MSAHQPSPAALRAAKRLINSHSDRSWDEYSVGSQIKMAGVIDAELAQVAALRERARELEQNLKWLLEWCESIEGTAVSRGITHSEHSIHAHSRALLTRIRSEREGGK